MAETKGPTPPLDGEAVTATTSVPFQHQDAGSRAQGVTHEGGGAGGLHPDPRHGLSPSDAAARGCSPPGPANEGGHVRD